MRMQGKRRKRRRVLEALQSYGREREGVRHEKRAG